MPVADSRGKILRLKKYPIAHMNKQKLPSLRRYDKTVSTSHILGLFQDKSNF